MSSYEAPYGFALRRNGSCLAEESSCGGTWGTWSACCPHGTICPGKYETIYNNVCCPTKADCTNAFKSNPHCADKKWVLYDENGGFCCEEGQQGFVTGNEFVGCADGPPPDRSETVLAPVYTTSYISSTIVSHHTTSSSSTSTSTSTSESTASTGKTNTGAIVGGVVGGIGAVAVLIALGWFLLRRRKQNITSDVKHPQAELEESPQPVWAGSNMVSKVSNENSRHEMDGNQVPYELPAH